MTLSRSNPRAKPRWMALFALVAIATAMLATTALAAPSFTFVPDELGPDDEPGQKDLTAQASAFDGGSFYSAWRWDDTSWSGKNTGDGCSLFTSDADELVDYAVCATIGGKSLVLQTVTVYSCNDTRADRCGNPVLLGTFSGTNAQTYCQISQVGGTFGGTDTQIQCNISALSTAVGGISALSGSSLLNTCSYPSREPNSDPSDCVLEAPANVDVSLSTTSDGTMAWTATLTDTATLTPAGTGSVEFKLYSGTPCSDDATTGNLVATSTDTSAPFAATPVQVSGTGSQTFYWTVTYTPDTGFNGDSEVCGEPVTITATIIGSTSP